MEENTVGLRELQARLSAFLRLVKEGETVTLTERGQPVARMVPVETGLVARLETLRDASLVEWSGNELPPAGERRPLRRTGTVADLIVEGRQ